MLLLSERIPVVVFRNNRHAPTGRRLNVRLLNTTAHEHPPCEALGEPVCEWGHRKVQLSSECAYSVLLEPYECRGAWSPCSCVRQSMQYHQADSCSFEDRTTLV